MKRGSKRQTIPESSSLARRRDSEVIKRIGACLLAGVLLAGSVSSASPVPPLPHTDLVIDIGHGGVDGGTSFGTILEKDINLGVGLKLYPQLRKKGISAGMTRMTDYALSDDNAARGSRHRRDLAQRVEIANRVKPDALISLHVNWSTDRRKTGPLVIYRKNDPASKRLAEHLQSGLNVLYGVSTKPEPGRKYYLLRHSRSPAVIVEMGYLSNSRDRGLLISPGFQKKLADALAAAVEQALKDPLLQEKPVHRRVR